MRKCLFLFWLFLTLWVLGSQTARACSCVRLGPTTCPDFKVGGTSFVGTVIDIENPAADTKGADQSGESRYRFRIDENINGVVAKELDVYSGRGGADCSVHFQLGKSYFVDPYSNDGRLFATICSDTQPAADAEPMLSELRARRDGKKYASVYGILRRTQQPYVWTSSDNFDRPLAGVTIELHGKSHILSTQTDQAGVYRFYSVPADTYHFGATLPPNLELAQSILNDPLPPITLPDNACYEQDIDAFPTGRIRGRVIGPDDKPLKNAAVSLFRMDRYKQEDMGWWEYQDEQNGYFEFNHVTPGTYVVVFNNPNNSDPDIPYPRTFYPGTPTIETALPIAIADDQQILNADIHVFGGSPTRLLTVRVNWSENPPPSDVYVTAEASEGAQPIAKKLSPGVYQLTLFRAGRYSIFAEQDCGLRWEGDTGKPIGARETERMIIDGSDDRTTEITLSLQDRACKPYSQQKH